MPTPGQRDSSLRREWQRRHSNGWLSVLHEYADGLFAGIAHAPDGHDHTDVFLLYEGWHAAMAHADEEVARRSNHRCDEGCGRWILA